MIESFMMWLQEPGKWNDLIALCGVVILTGFIAMFNGNIRDFFKQF